MPVSKKEATAECPYGIIAVSDRRHPDDLISEVFGTMILICEKGQPAYRFMDKDTAVANLQRMQETPPHSGVNLRYRMVRCYYGVLPEHTTVQRPAENNPTGIYAARQAD